MARRLLRISNRKRNRRRGRRGPLPGEEASDARGRGGGPGAAAAAPPRCRSRFFFRFFVVVPPSAGCARGGAGAHRGRPRHPRLGGRRGARPGRGRCCFCCCSRGGSEALFRPRRPRLCRLALRARPRRRRRRRRLRGGLVFFFGGGARGDGLFRPVAQGRRGRAGRRGARHKPRALSVAGVPFRLFCLSLFVFCGFLPASSPSPCSRGVVEAAGGAEASAGRGEGRQLALRREREREKRRERR